MNSMTMSCIFCKIAKKEIPKEFIYEDDYVVAFCDLHPIAPVHVLIIPKKHIASTNDLDEKDACLAGKLILAAKQIAADLQISEKGYKLLIRTGSDGGQEVPHVHLHLIGGARLHEEIRPMNM